MANASTEYDDEQQLANAFVSAVNSYLGSQNNFYGGEYDAMNNALQDQLANPANAPIAPTYAQLDPDWQTKYGVPVYQGDDGSLYDASGNGFDPRTQGSPVQPDQPWSVGLKEVGGVIVRALGCLGRPCGCAGSCFRSLRLRWGRWAKRDAIRRAHIRHWAKRGEKGYSYSHAYDDSARSGEV